jgi:hypothetical protein
MLITGGKLWYNNEVVKIIIMPMGSFFGNQETAWKIIHIQMYMSASSCMQFEVLNTYTPKLMEMKSK